MAGFGMTKGELDRSIKRAHPLGPIAKKDRAAFLESLNDDEIETLRRAEEWYYLTFR